MVGACFVGPEDQEQFQRPGRRVPRTLRALPLPDAGDAGGRRVELAQLLRDRVESFGRRETRWFEVNCVRVRRDDGMSWSAETARLTLADLRVDFRLVALSQRMALAQLPQIAAFVGRKRLLALAGRHLGGPRASQRRWLRPVMVLGSLALAGLITGVHLHLESRLGSMAAPLSSPLFYVGSVLLTLLSMLGEKLLLGGGLGASDERLDELDEALQQARGKAAYDSLVGALVERLAAEPFPRFVVVDDFEALDGLTRDVAARYLNKHAERGAGSELWVVFEREGGERLSGRLIDKAAAYTLQRTHVFDQEFLSTAERERLAEHVGHPEWSAFTTVKSVSFGVQEGAPWVETLFKEHRSRHPAKAGAAGSLEFLYLLGFNSLGGNVPLALGFVERTLARKAAGLRPDLLKVLLPGTRLTKAEFRAQLQDVQREFGSVCATEGEGLQRAIRVRREAAVYLEEHHAELALPSPAVGHLFWASFWLDRLRGRPVQAFWVRKLAQHLLRLTPTALHPSLARTLPAFEEELFTALLFAAEGALRTCLFDLVDDLLEAAYALVEGREETSWLARLQSRCWESYCLLASERSLRLAFQLRELVTESAEDKAAEPLDASLDLFFQALPLSPALRSRLTPWFVRAMLGGAARIESVNDYAAVRTAWLALTGAALLREVETGSAPQMQAAARQALESVLPTAARVLERVRQSPADARRLVDLETLSLGLWCAARGLGLELRVWLETLASEPRTAESPPAGVSLSRLPADWAALLKLAEDTVALAGGLRGAATAAPEGAESDYVAHALARELCAVALAAVLAGARALSFLGVAALAGPWVDQAERLFRSVERLLEHRLVDEGAAFDFDSGPLHDRVAGLLELSAVVWSHFGLDRLRDLVALRQLEFQAACGGLHAEDSARFVPLLEALAPALAEPGFLGLLTNLVVAEARASVRELAAHYVHEAAQMALDPGFGVALQEELCLLALLHGHLPKDRADLFLARLLRVESDGGSALSRLARAVPPGDAEGFCMRLLNLRTLVDPGHVEPLVKVVADMAEAVAQPRAGRQAGASRPRDLRGEPDVQAQLRAMLDMFSVEQALARGTALDGQQVLAEWPHGREGWTFASVLQALLANGHGGAVRLAADQALERDPAQDNYNTWFNLAAWCCAQSAVTASARAARADAPADASPATRYLRGSIDRWKRLASADTNVQAYQALAMLDPPRRMEFLAEVQRWLAVKIERDHLKRLPALARLGRFFLVFEDYHRSLRFWGLPTDAQDEHLFRELNWKPEERVAAVRAWQAGGEPVPQPIVTMDGARAVSSRFLVLGHCLFSPPLAQRGELDEARRGFDVAAQRQLRPLVQMILGLRTLPGGIRDLLESYSQRFIEYWVPAE